MAPRFVVDTGDRNLTLTKSKYADLSLRERLQVFIDLACYCDDDDLDRVLIDPSDENNRMRAGKWFENELTFLSKQDETELRYIWESAIEDGFYTRLLFSAVKQLQEKYSG